MQSYFWGEKKLFFDLYELAFGRLYFKSGIVLSHIHFCLFEQWTESQIKRKVAKKSVFPNTGKQLIKRSKQYNSALQKNKKLAASWLNWDTSQPMQLEICSRPHFRFD